MWRVRGGDTGGSIGAMLTMAFMLMLLVYGLQIMTEITAQRYLYDRTDVLRTEISINGQPTVDLATYVANIEQGFYGGNVLKVLVICWGYIGQPCGTSRLREVGRPFYVRLEAEIRPVVPFVWMGPPRLVTIEASGVRASVTQIGP